MSLFGRRKPLHRALADAAGLDLGAGEAPPRAGGLAPAPPGWDGEQRGEPGIHGVPRARRWDTVTAVEAPSLRGDTVHFVALDDETLVVEEDEPDAAVDALATAVQLAPPYRAEAVRRKGDTWAVAASRIELTRVTSIRGDTAALVVTRDTRTLTVDGRPTFGSAPELERVGVTAGREFVVRAERVDGDLWQVDATPL